MESNLGQFCINVSDLERSVQFYTEVLGLEVQSRTEIPNCKEAIVWRKGKGGALQLAQHLDGPDAIDQSADGIRKTGALWKLYLNTDDCKGLHAKAVAAGAKSLMDPFFAEEWNVTIAFVEDPDGYHVEIIEGMDLDANAPS